MFVPGLGSRDIGLVASALDLSFGSWAFSPASFFAGHFSQSVRKNFFEGFFEEYDEEYDEEYALDFRPQRAQEACNGDAAFCASWLLEASDSQSSFLRSQQMTEILSS